MRIHDQRVVMRDSLRLIMRHDDGHRCPAFIPSIVLRRDDDGVLPTVEIGVVTSRDDWHIDGKAAVGSDGNRSRWLHRTIFIRHRVLR